MKRSIETTFLLTLAIASISSAARGQSPAWADGFTNVGATLSPSELRAFDAGAGERLYVCSKDQFQLSAPGMIRRHDGNAWDDFHADVAGRVLASAVWDDGTGPAFYLAGSFTTIGGVAANSIARFDGTSFTALGTGITGTVDALAVHDDGTGPALYAVGVISGAGGSATNGVARWDGSSWSAIATISGLPYDCVTLDDGSGPALYVAGDFFPGNGTSPNVARWNGSGWTYLPILENGAVSAITVHDDGSGPTLYAATLPGGSSVQVVRWNGAFWTTVGPSFNGKIFDLESSGVGGNGLIAVGEFTTIGFTTIRAAARWNGTQWTAISSTFTQSGCNPTAFSIANFDPSGGPPVLVLAGCFYGSAAGAIHAPFEWDGQRVSSLFTGHGLNSTVGAQLVYDDGTGEALYAGGAFTRAGILVANHVARWNGAMWAPVGNGTNSKVNALASHDDGIGARLYAGTGNGVERWNGGHWSDVGTGIGLVTSLAVLDAGSGAELYAAHISFDLQIEDYVRRVSRWDGATWTGVGDVFDGDVLALAVHDAGSGPELYAAGAFAHVGASSIPFLARWNGSAWTTIGPGPNGPVASLVSFDDGNGSALYAGGSFTQAAGNPALAIAKLQSGAWSALGGGLGSTVHALAAADDGTGTKLFAGGTFDAPTPGGAAHRIARWDGTSWSPLGDGVVGAGAFVASLASYQSSWTSAPLVTVGGFFGRAGSGLSSHIAGWGPQNDGVAACFGDGVLASCPCSNTSPIGKAAGCKNSTGQGGVLRSTGEASVTSDSFALLGSGMPNSFVIYFQGTNLTAFGAGVALDDGLGCASGAAIRLATLQNQSGGSSVPNAQFPNALSVSGLVPAIGATRVYQARYRDVAGPCGTLVNRTNAVIVSWRP